MMSVNLNVNKHNNIAPTITTKIKESQTNSCRFTCIDVARIKKNGGGQKWTSEVKTFLVLCIVLKSRDYVFKMSVFKKLSIVLYSVHWYMYTFILKS